MGSLCTTMKRLCCCCNDRRTAPEADGHEMHQQNRQTAAVTHDTRIAQNLTHDDPQTRPHGSINRVGFINPIATPSNVYSDEAGHAERSQMVMPEASSNTPAEHAMDDLSDNSDFDDATQTL